VVTTGAEFCAPLAAHPGTGVVADVRNGGAMPEGSVWDFVAGAAKENVALVGGCLSSARLPPPPGRRRPDNAASRRKRDQRTWRKATARGMETLKLTWTNPVGTG
jgi:hypothetical protein